VKREEKTSGATGFFFNLEFFPRKRWNFSRRADSASEEEKFHAWLNLTSENTSGAPRVPPVVCGSARSMDHANLSFMYYFEVL
jgi:hypothetical protein